MKYQQDNFTFDLNNMDSYFDPNPYLNEMAEEGWELVAFISSVQANISKPIFSYIWKKDED